MKILISLYSNDAETVWNAFRFANTALARNDEVSVFLLGKGVEAAMVGTLKYDIEEQLGIFRQAGGKLIGCGLCCDIRKNEMPSLLDGLQCEMGSMQLLHELVANAEKVLTF